MRAPGDAARSSGRGPARSRGWLVAAGLLGVTVALLATHPLIAHLRSSVPAAPDCPFERCADFPLCVWIVGWGGHQIYRNPLHLFEGNIFHPFRHTFAYSESMLSAGALVGPVNALTGNPILGYNLYYLATYALSFVGGFLLVREITGDPRAGLVAGLAFALAAERFEFRGFLPAIAIQWAPFVLFALMRFLDAPGAWRGLGLGAALVAHMHAGAYHGLVLPVLLVPWALVLIAFGPWPVRRWLPCAAVLGAAAAVALALYLPYGVVREEMQYAPAIGGVAWPRQYWGPFAAPGQYIARRLFGGGRVFFASPLPILLLVAAAAAVALRRWPAVPRQPGEGAHLAASLVLLLGAISVSLGPAMWVGRRVVHLPWFYLGSLPAFSSMRAIVRFMVLATFPASLVAGLATATILRRIRSGAAGWLFVALLGIVIVADDRTLREPMSLVRLTAPEELAPVYRWLATMPEDTAVLELPYASWGQEARYMVDSLYHGRRMVNGYSAILPRIADVIGGFPDPVSLRALRDAGVDYVIAHTDRLEADPIGRQQLARLLRRRDLASSWHGKALVVTVPPGATRASPPAGHELSRAGWQLEASDTGASLAADGDLTTHWTARTLERETFLRVDLGTPTAVSGAQIRLGPHVLEYPRRYEVRASEDGTSWETVGGEAPTLPPYVSYRGDHRNVELPLRMRRVRARYLEIRVPAETPVRAIFVPARWGVHELVVYADDATPASS